MTGSTAPHSKDFQAACFGIQQQLENLKSKTDPMSIEESCILSALIYVDKMLLNSLVKRNSCLPQANNFSTQLCSQVLRSWKKIRRFWTEYQPQSPLCISLTAVSLRGPILCDKFNALVTRLDELHIT